MKKKILMFLFILAIIFPSVMYLTACGENEKQVKNIVVELANNQYSLVNNQINVEWGEYVSLTDTDFSVKVEFDDGTTKSVLKQTAEKAGFTYQTTLPALNTLDDGKTPIGTYTVTIGYDKADDYVVTINVTKQNISLPAFVWGQSSFEYDGTEKVVEIETQLPSYVSVSYENNRKTEVGNYVATAIFTSTDDHYNLNTTTATKVWQIDKAIVTLVAPTAKTGLAYNGEEQVLVNAGTATGGELQYRIEGGVYSNELPTATNAGTYAVYYKVVGDENHNDIAEASVEVTIAKANYDMSCITFESANYDYDGTEKSILINGSLPADVTVQYTGNEQTEANETGYTVTAKFIGDETNYNAIADKTAVLIIRKVNATLVAPTAKTNLVYNGDEKVLVNAGTATGGELQYKLDGGEYSTTLPTATNAGTYTVYYKVVGDANHNDTIEASVQVSIAKAESDLVAPTAKTGLAYNGEAQYLINEGTATGGELQYKLDDGTYSTLVPKATNAGTYTVYYKVAGDDNHNDIAEASVEVTIAKVDAMLIYSPEPIENLACNGNKQQLVNVGEAIGGELQYKLEGGIYSNEIPTATNAGTYTVYYKVVGDENHNDTIEASFEVEIFAVVGFEQKNVFIIGDNYIYYFQVWAVLSNGEKVGINLADCVSEDQLASFDEATHYDGEIYDFNASYAGCNATLQIAIAKLDVETIRFAEPRQYIRNNFNKDLIVKLNNTDSGWYYELDQEEVLIVSILDQNYNSYESYTDVKEEGTYTFIIQIGLSTEYDNELNKTVWVYSSEKVVVLTLAGDDGVNGFGINSTDIVVGQRPLFWYSTYDGNYYNDQDILDQITYNSADFDYNNAGTYNVTFTFNGIDYECTITVHNPSETTYLNIYGVYVIGGENKLKISAHTWGGDDIYEDFDLAYIIGDMPNLTTAGEYDITFQYEDITYDRKIKVVNDTDPYWISLAEQYFELNTTEKVKIHVYCYNDTSYYTELTPEMIIYGTAPNLNVVGTYNFEIEYLGATSYCNVYVYDPTDTTVKNINWVNNNQVVWTYTPNGDEYTINALVDGLFVNVERANRTQELIAVTADMISYNYETAKTRIKENAMAGIQFTLTYQGVERTGYVVLINEAMLNDISELCTKKIMQYGSIKNEIAIEVNGSFDGYYLVYTYEDYNYYVKITSENVLDDNNQPHSIYTAGAYDVTVNGEPVVLIVYDWEDVNISALTTGGSIGVLENSNETTLRDVMIGASVWIRYNFDYPYHGDQKRYSFSEDIVLTADNIGDLSQVDLSTVGSVEIPVIYNGYSFTVSINVNPNLDGQTKNVYKMSMYGFEVTVDVYDEYVQMSGNYYRYEYIDSELNIVKVSTGMNDMLFVVNNDNMRIVEFNAGVTFSEDTPVEYVLINGDDTILLKLYRNRFIDVYEYDDKKDSYDYQQTMLCDVEIEDGKTYLTFMGTKYFANDANQLTIAVVGDIIYEFETEVDGTQMKAEFREYNGIKTMYYYNLVGDEYELVPGTLRWEIDDDETLITCYYGSYTAVQFTVSNGVIIGMVMDIK